jgi:hypothetical protein
MVVNPLGAETVSETTVFHPDSGTSRKLFFMGWQGRLTALFANGCPDVEISGYAFGTANECNGDSLTAGKVVGGRSPECFESSVLLSVNIE